MYQRTKSNDAMCIRNFSVQNICSSHYLSHLAAFFIDLRRAAPRFNPALDALRFRLQQTAPLSALCVRDRCRSLGIGHSSLRSACRSLCSRLPALRFSSGYRRRRRFLPSHRSQIALLLALDAPTGGLEIALYATTLTPLRCAWIAPCSTLQASHR